MNPNTGIGIAAATLTAVVGLAAGLALAPASADEPATVPPVCLEAIASARDGFSAAADFSDVVARLFGGALPDAVEAAYYRDVAGMDRATALLEQAHADMDRATVRLEGNRFGEQAAACEEAAR